MRAARRFILNAASNWVAMGVRLLVTVLLLRYLIDRLGPAATGIWQTVGSFLAFVAVLDFGLALAVRRLAARFAVLQESAEQNHLISTSVFAYAALAAGVALLTEALSPLSPSLFAADLADSGTAAEVVRLFRVVGAAAFVRLMVTPFAGFLQGLQRYEASNAASVVGSMARLGLTVALIETVSPRLVWPGVALLVGSAIEAAMLIASAVCFWPGLQIRLRWVSREHLREILSLAGWAFVITLGALGLTQLPNFIIGKMIGPAAVTAFAAGLVLSAMLRELLTGLAGVLMPAFSAAQAHGDTEEIGDLLWGGSQVVNLVAWTLIGGLVVFAEPVVENWVGREMLAGYWSVVVLVLGEAAMGGDSVATSALAGCGQMRGLAISRMMTAMVGIPMAAAAIKPLGVGITGVALAVSLPTVVRGIWVPWYACRKLGLPFRSYWVRSSVRPLIACAAIVAVGLVARRYVPTESGLALAGVGVLMGVVSVVLGWSIGMSPGIRRQLWEVLRHGGLLWKGQARG